MAGEAEFAGSVHTNGVAVMCLFGAAPFFFLSQRNPSGHKSSHVMGNASRRRPISAVSPSFIMGDTSNYIVEVPHSDRAPARSFTPRLSPAVNYFLCRLLAGFFVFVMIGVHHQRPDAVQHREAAHCPGAACGPHRPRPIALHGRQPTLDALGKVQPIDHFSMR